MNTVLTKQRSTIVHTTPTAKEAKAAHQRRNDLWYHTTRALFSLVSRHALPLTVVGQENLALLTSTYPERPIIVAASHVSRFDPWIVAHVCHTTLPVIHFFAKKELTNYRAQCQDYDTALANKPAWVRYLVSRFMARLTVWVVGNSHTIPVDRDNITSRTNARAVRQAREMLTRHAPVGIFPQAGVHWDITEAKDIAVALAVKTNAVIVPIHLDDKPEKWCPVHPWNVTIGQPIAGEQLTELAKSSKPGHALMLHINSLATPKP